MTTLIESRAAAGTDLARVLSATYRGRDDVVVVAMPPGGVPVASEIARALGAPLEIMVVRKLSAPGHADVAFGALAERSRVLDWNIVSGLEVTDETIDQVTQSEQVELERLTRLYRGRRLQASVEGRIVILVDDGVVTGGTARAAIGALRAQQPAQLILAIGAGPYDAVTELRAEVDELVCLKALHPFCGLDRCYWNYPRVGEREAAEVLAAHWTVADLAPGATRDIEGRAVDVGATRTAQDARVKTARRAARGRRVSGSLH